MQIGTSISALWKHAIRSRRPFNEDGQTVRRPEASKQAEPPKQPDTATQAGCIQRVGRTQDADRHFSSRHGGTSIIASWLRKRPPPLGPLRRRPATTKRRRNQIKEIIGRSSPPGRKRGGHQLHFGARNLDGARFLSYRNGPLLGRGLGAAHALQPHNTFLLFAVAFGDLGWLVPLAFLGLTAYWVRQRAAIAAVLATFTVMMTSHDVLFTPGLLAPIVFGIGGLNAQRHRFR